MACGSCNCKEIQFTISRSITDVFVCHCSICRKSTGSGGIAVAIVENKDFKWTSDLENLVNWHKPNHDWQTSFCAKCGSPLPGKNCERTTYVPVSLLDSGYEALKVKHHLFVGSKGAWEIIADSGKQHSDQFEI